MTTLNTAAEGRGPQPAVASRFARRARSLGGLPKILARTGALDVRLATTKKEIRCAQKLRYRVFFEEGGARADPAARLIKRDVCPFDRVCDHLIVVDNSLPRLDGAPTVVGVYRLLRQEIANANFGFYSGGEFCIEPMIARHPDKKFMELGRSCVAEGYRGKRTLELLWRGVWAYALHHRVDVMFGCASLPGIEPAAHLDTLRFLRGEGAPDELWSVEALADGFDVAAVAGAETFNARAALRALPPLLKGYWRLGARFSRQAVADPVFATTDVLVVLPIEEIRSRYLAHFAPPGESQTLAA